MSKKKRDYTAEFKVDFVLQALTYPDGITAYCRKEGIKESRFYAWKSTMIKNAKETFNRVSKKESLRIRLLQQELQHKKESIAALSEMLIDEKKKMDYYEK